MVGRLLLYGAVWGGVLLLSWYTFQQGRRVGGTASWAGLLYPVLFGLTAWPVLRDFVAGERWLTIPNLILVITYLALTLGSVHFVLYFEDLGHIPLQDPSAVRRALLVAICGVVAYRIAAEVPWFRGVTRRLPELPSTPGWSWGLRIGVFGAIALAVLLKLVLAAMGSFGYSVSGGDASSPSGLLSILIFVSYAGLFALSCAYFHWFSGTDLSRIDRTFIVGATAVLGGFALMSGMKHEFVFVFFGVAVPYMWTRRRASGRPRSRMREVVIGLVMVGLMLALFALNPLYRRALDQLRGTKSRLQQAPEAASFVIGEVANQAEYPALLATGAERMWSRMSAFPFYVKVIDEVPEQYDFRHFDRFPLLPAVALVPRVLWPGKPTNTRGTDFHDRFVSGDFVNSTTPTMFGWAYMEQGLVGVVLVMFALGGLAGLTESYLAESQSHKTAALLLYTAVFFRLIQLEQDPFWLLAGLAKLLMVAGFTYLLMLLPDLLIGRFSFRP